MKKILYVFAVTGIVWVSCNKEQPQPMSKNEMRARVDSMTRILKQESDESARRDLDYRLKIDLKVKVDSILNARQNKKVKDTLTKKPLL